MWERSGYLTNSQMTTTTKRLSQNTMYKDDNLRDMKREFRRSTDDLGLDLSLSNSGNLRKSVSFNDLKKVRHFSEAEDSDDSIDEELQRLIDRDDAENEEMLARVGKPKSKYESEWYTKPLHLTNNEYPVMSKVGLPTRSVSPVNRPVGSMGALLAAKQLGANQFETARAEERWASPRAHSPVSPRRSHSPRLSPYGSRHHSRTVGHIDDLVTDYFPVTLRASQSVRSALTEPNTTSMSPSPYTPVERTLSPPPKGLHSVDSPERLALLKSKKKKSKKGTRSSSRMSASAMSERPHSNVSMASTVNGLHFMADEATVTGASAVLLSSPYQHEIARLRMERLRLEEEHLLEVKRQQELERIRGPKPKWYELKTPQFHYEAQKNNELLKHSGNYQGLMDYRKSLLQASQEFQRAYTPDAYS